MAIRLRLAGNLQEVCPQQEQEGYQHVARKPTKHLCLQLGRQDEFGGDAGNGYRQAYR